MQKIVCSFTKNWNSFLFNYGSAYCQSVSFSPSTSLRTTPNTARMLLLGSWVVGTMEIPRSGGLSKPAKQELPQKAIHKISDHDRCDRCAAFGRQFLFTNFILTAHQLSYFQFLVTWLACSWQILPGGLRLQMPKWLEKQCVSCSTIDI